jgi:hypothetical protein
LVPAALSLPADGGLAGMCAMLHAVLSAIGLCSHASGSGCSAGVEFPGSWFGVLPELIDPQFMTLLPWC